MAYQEPKERPVKGGIRKFLDLTGRVTLVYTILSSISKLESWSQVLGKVQAFSQDLFNIFQFIARLVHYVLIPWRHVTSLFFELIPVRIPQDLHDAVILAILISVYPIVYFKARKVEKVYLKLTKLLQDLKSIVEDNGLGATNPIETRNKMASLFISYPIQPYLGYLSYYILSYFEELFKEDNSEPSGRVDRSMVIYHIEMLSTITKVWRQTVSKRLKLSRSKFFSGLVILSLIFFDHFFFDQNYSLSMMAGEIIKVISMGVIVTILTYITLAVVRAVLFGICFLLRFNEKNWRAWRISFSVMKLIDHVEVLNGDFSLIRFMPKKWQETYWNTYNETTLRYTRLLLKWSESLTEPNKSVESG